MAESAAVAAVTGTQRRALFLHAPVAFGVTIHVHIYARQRRAPIFRLHQQRPMNNPPGKLLVCVSEQDDVDPRHLLG